MVADYLLKVQEHCADTMFGQQAVEHAINSQLVTLSYDLTTDVAKIMENYDAVVSNYHQHLRQQSKLILAQR